MIKIYIITTNTGTYVSKIIKHTLGVPYPHVSIALEDNLEKMYSLGRKYTKFVLPGGFIEEGINKGLFKAKKNTSCTVYSLYISEEQYIELKYNIDKCIKNKKNIKYDVLSLLTLINNKNRVKHNRYVCSTFVGWVLESSNIKLFDKPYSLLTPLDFYKHKLLNVEYEGLLSEYNVIKNNSL